MLAPDIACTAGLVCTDTWMVHRSISSSRERFSCRPQCECPQTIFSIQAAKAVCSTPSHTQHACLWPTSIHTLLRADLQALASALHMLSCLQIVQSDAASLLACALTGERSCERSFLRRWSGSRLGSVRCWYATATKVQYVSALAHLHHIT